MIPDNKRMNNNKKKVNVLRFIDLYRSHEVLWNMNLSSYRRNDLKKKAYESIADEMNMSVQEVKKKIKSLRTAYSAEKAKVERVKKSGCNADSMYIPTVFWFNEMSFLNTSFVNRAKINNTKQETIDVLVDSNTLDESFSAERAEIVTPSYSKKKKRSPEPKSKLDDALDKLIAINKSCSVFEAFGENVGRQLSEFPEVEAYQLMADIQTMLSKRKINILEQNDQYM